MIQIVHPLAANARLEGEILIPASKSHTIRALLISALADGESLIINPLESKDARSCIETVRLFGATLEEIPGAPWGAERAIRVKGIGGRDAEGRLQGILGQPADNVIDTGNSGTTLYLAASLAALTPNGTTVFTGDHQIRSRPIGNLLKALQDFGATAFATKNNGRAPVVIGGPIKGGSTTIECPTSQFLSSLLIALPLADTDRCEINVTLLHEQPYAEMTLRWLDEQGIKYENHGWKRFVVPGRQSYRPFEKVVPGDFSSATFFACAAAITGSKLTLTGLDMDDSQGDKAVLSILEAMGCLISFEKNNSAQGITIIGPGHPNNPCKLLQGGSFDLNDIPDSLPALSVTAAYACAEVRLINVPQARLKETDRIAMMHHELGRMGALITEVSDGLIIQPSGHLMAGADVESHDDHRIAMSMALAALRAKGPNRIAGAECAAVTFPGFFRILNELGAQSTSVGA